MTDFLLREWRLTDKASLSENANNINVWNNLRDYFPSPYTEEDGEQFIQTVMDTPKPASTLAIEVDGKAVGGVGIILKSDVERISAEIGYWIGESYWYRGIMTNAVKQMADYAFEQFPITKIYATVFDFNIPSMKVLQKAGFTFEAVLKQCAIKNGRIIDMHYYGLLKGEN